MGRALARPAGRCPPPGPDERTRDRREPPFRPAPETHGLSRPALAEANVAFIAAHQRVADIAGGFGAAAKVFRAMLQSGVLALGASLVIRGEASPGAIIASSIFVSRALAPAELAVAHWKGFVATRQAWHRLSDLLARLPAEAQPHGLPAPTRTVTVEGLGIAPPRHGAPRGARPHPRDPCRTGAGGDRARFARGRFASREGPAPHRRRGRRTPRPRGARVKAGDVLIRLDATQARASLATIRKALDELVVRRARVEAQLQIGERTVVSYLTRPLTDQIAKAWRER